MKKNYFRFEKYLVDLFKHLNNVWSSIEGKMKSEAFKVKIRYEYSAQLRY